MLQVDIEGRTYSLVEFFEIFNRVFSDARCRALREDGSLCDRLSALRQGSAAEPRCLEHTQVQPTVH